jgi:hypothetical protein
MGPDPENAGIGERSFAGSGVVARLTRRHALQRGAVALGGVAGLGLLDPGSVLGSAFAPPRPIPGGLSLSTGTFEKNGDLHFFLPGIGYEMSTITDFNGVVGGSQTRGTAQGTDGTTSTSYSFDCDMRFMRGAYVGVDGRMHNGSFGFI